MSLFIALDSSGLVAPVPAASPLPDAPADHRWVGPLRVEGSERISDDANWLYADWDRRQSVEAMTDAPEVVILTGRLVPVLREGRLATAKGRALHVAPDGWYVAIPARTSELARNLARATGGAVTGLRSTETPEATAAAEAVRHAAVVEALAAYAAASERGDSEAHMAYSEAQWAAEAVYRA
jgi:hypothetical protein